jgi:hypothetical protein
MAIIYPSTKKRAKKKPTKADLEAEAAFVQLNAKWDRMYGKVTSKKPRAAEIPVLTCPPGRGGVHHPSRTTPGGSTAPKENQRYSGDKIKGVMPLHKSSIVPVFSNQEILDVSRMRR